MCYHIAVIGGDGIGPEVIEATVYLLRRLTTDFDFEFLEAGDSTYETTGEALPKKTLEGALKADAVLLGACGETAADVVIRLRQELETYTNLRPIRALQGITCMKPATDLVIVRENTECLYKGIENEISPGVTTATRVITERASTKIGNFAFDYAKKQGYQTVTAIHKVNVLPKTDGLFLESIDQIAKKRKMDYEKMLVDAAALHLVMNPERFDVIVTTNMFGDILSDLSGGLIGGLGLCPSANIGENHGLFEPVHGTAPDIAQKGLANPTATILSACHMLKFLGETEAAKNVQTALQQTIIKGKTTPDLGGNLGTMEMASEIEKNLIGNNEI